MKVLTFIGKTLGSGKLFFTHVAHSMKLRAKESMFSEFFNPADAICAELDKIAKEQNRKLEFSPVIFEIEIKNVQFPEVDGGQFPSKKRDELVESHLKEVFDKLEKERNNK